MSKKCEECNEIALEEKSLCFYHDLEKQKNRYKFITNAKETVVSVGPAIVIITGALVKVIKRGFK